ncbi:MAG: hypothetical protein ACJASR_000743 [Psychroserpens sp.]|jgi:hypothetical protein
MRQKKLTLCIVLLIGIGSHGLKAQESINSAGGNAIGNGGSSSYSIGQVFYITNVGTNGSVAQGVQQNFCTDSDVPTITATPSTICPGTSTTLDWSGAALNDATNWHIYTTTCGVDQLTAQPGTSLIVSPAMTTTYYIRGEDGSGCLIESTILCGFVTVTVEDNTPPEAICQNITVQLDPAGNAFIMAADVDNGSNDTCGIASYDLDIDTFDCSNVGPNPVVLTVTDVNGNVASCTAVVTVEDNIIPTLVCMDITLELGADGTATISPSDLLASIDDNCGIFSTAVNITDFDCDDVGTPVTVIVFALDNNGNSTICNAVVTVVDMLDPVLSCPADQTVDPGPGALFYEVPDYFATGEATAVDNCTDPIVLITQSPVAGTLLPDGVHIITLTAEDENGNIASCSFDLTVESTLGVGDLGFDISSIILYPSPANNYIILDNPKAIPLSSLMIKDLNGRLIMTIDLNDMEIERVVDISVLEMAPYIVIIDSDQGRLVKQIIKSN